MTKQTRVILIVAIAGACCAGVILILILAAIAIPATQSVIRKGNEASAINVLKLINTAEQQYAMTYPQRGFACSLAALGGSAQTGPATPDAAQLIPDELSSGVKAGYRFSVTNCASVTAKGADQVTSYTLTAVPLSPGHTGNRGYCSDETGELRFDPMGGTNCTEQLQPTP